MLIERFVFSPDGLETINRVSIDRRMPLTHDFQIKVSHRPEDEAALAAVSNGVGVIGVAIGKRDDGTPTLMAVKLDADGSFRHGEPIPLKVGAFAST